jgi:hypothetical protein
MKEKFDIKFDIRVIDRNIRDGVINENDYNTHLKELEDVSENAEAIVIDDSDEEEIGEEIEVSSSNEEGDIE